MERKIKPFNSIKNQYKNTPKWFYYMRDKNREPRTTICLIQVENDQGLEGIYARGITICSKKDTISKKVGRYIAEQRALKAIEYLKDSGYNLIDYRLSAEYHNRNDIEIVPEQELSDFEKRLLGLEKPEKIVTG